MTSPLPSLFDELVRTGVASKDDFELRARIARAEAVADVALAIGHAFRWTGRAVMAGFRRLLATDAGRIGSAQQNRNPANSGQRERDAA